MTLLDPAARSKNVPERYSWTDDGMEPDPQGAWVRSDATGFELASSALRRMQSIPAARVEPIPGGVARLRTDLDLTLTKVEVEYIAAFISDEAELTDDTVRLLIGDGHSGYGLYAACPDYQEEGAILVKSLSLPSSTPGLDPEAKAAPDCGACEDRKGCILSRECARGVSRYEGRALCDGAWLPWHPISAEVYVNRQKWPRDGYEVRVSGLDPIRSSDGEELEPVRKPQDPYGY